MTTIIVTHEDNEVDEFEFESGHEVITIGRRSDNDVAIPNLSISGKHAKIFLEDGLTFLEDLNSTNGTYVNGELVKRRTVQSGDDIILGKIRLGIILTEVANAVATKDDFDEAVDRQADANDDSMDFPVNNMASSPESADSDEMSFDEDARLFAQSPSEPVESNDDSVLSSALNGVHEDAHDSVMDSALDSAIDDAHAAHEDAMDNVYEDSLDSSENEVEEAPVVADFNRENQPHPLDGIDSKSLSREDNDAPPMHELDSPPVTSNGAVIEIKNGAKSGQILPIDKPVTTLGRPGIQIAAIMRKPDGYFLMHIESDDSVDRPTLNQDSIGDEPVLLHSGDELNVAGIDVEFMLS
ncbi:MAG: pSer/pThr/pTyr-binding forkhead associated (FHA) protein [Porticoccaceae bacterium]|jgi:pSer/pThr/pTyr-binding forkhead associated (FHA) protein